MFRSSILTAIFAIVAVGTTQSDAQQPAAVGRKPSAFDQPLLAGETFDRPQSLQRAEIEAYLRNERAAFDSRQRAIRAEENARMGVAILRPTRSSNPRMHSYYAPRRIIYVPYFVE